MFWSALGAAGFIGSKGSVLMTSVICPSVSSNTEIHCNGLELRKSNEASHFLQYVLCSAIASILRAWLDQCSEDFEEPPEYLCLKKILDYLTRTMPGSELERRARNLLEQFQPQEIVNYSKYFAYSVL